MDAAYLKEKHRVASPYEQYVRSGTPDQFANWQKIYEQTQLADQDRRLIESFVRRINVIALSGIWCGDCVQQCPLIQCIAQANPTCIDLRWIDRDEHIDLQKKLVINAGHRVPVFIFCAEDYEFVSWYGDRTLSRYRNMAKQQLGASCPLPGAAVSDNELAATLNDWVEQFERVHLLLRLSTRLRQKHGD